MTRLVFLGLATMDAIAVVPRLPGPDERLEALSVVHAGGGIAATASVAAARLGASAAFVGPVADDEEGERILAGLYAEGVDVSGVLRVPAGQGGSSVILVDQTTGSRAIATRPLVPFAIPPGLVAGADWVHVDHHGWPAVVPFLGGPARISVDAGNPIPDLVLDQVDLYVPTLAALRLRYPAATAPGELVELALADGARCVVATDGEHGSYGSATPGELVVAPGIAVDVRSTLGAGDVFHGALLVAISRGDSLADGMRFANAAAALSCRAVDGRSAIPTAAELAVWLSR
ncbi:PfkB family carbohydrate kinase [Tenggerimyces flavus]|uniref:PfkB family carbohydrate kinase n=1 Tax=Tenggerimyces flavus TaxID=1708749 RepID=A0ABV7YDX6_9ACTN|nr:PfkB family carbohydrate kinase [Tenggerimyces flavus]MBM7784274.1 sugar/nucleoside kinase (ribokinase family) [Tenggerimyces flavus]